MEQQHGTDRNSMRLAWTTDLHTKILTNTDVTDLLTVIKSGDFDALAVCGDIGESDTIEEFLIELAETLQRPIYFVLGNHDFYGSSIAETRRKITELAVSHDHLEYLTVSPPVGLTANTALVGHDGWGDARHGDFRATNEIVTDFKMIQELNRWNARGELVNSDGSAKPLRGHLLTPEHLDRSSLESTLNQLGDEAALHFSQVLREAFEEYQNVVAITHVPPFPELCLIGENHSFDDLPFYCCGAVGQVMMSVMRQRPSQNLRVLCGHTHDGGAVRILDNLAVVCGDTGYAEPKIQGVLDVRNDWPPGDVS